MTNGTAASMLRSLPRPPVVLTGIVAVGAALRVYRFDALSLWLDEGITVHVARLSWPTVLGLYGAYETHPPLYFVLVKLATLATSELHAGRVISLLAGTATIPVLYALATRLFGAWPALVASAALAISPLHIWYSREARMYALSMLLVTGSYLALVSFFRSPRRSTAALYGVAVLAAMYANYGALFTLIPQIAPLTMAARRHGRSGVALWIAGGAAALAYLPWVPVLLSTTRQLGALRQDYLGVSLERIWASVISITGLGGAGSYFWGSQTPWEQWPRAAIGLVPALVLVGVASVAALLRRPLSLAVVAGFLPGTLAVAAGLSLLSPGYAERTVLAGVAGWALLLGSLASDRLPLRLRACGWAGAIVVLCTSVLTLRAIYLGDKQHWDDLASQTATAATLGAPVWAYPTYTGTLIDVYQPGVFGLATPSHGTAANRVIADGVEAPASDADAIWLAYVESAGVDRIQRQLADRGYGRLMHRYHWHALYLDLYARNGVPLGRPIEIDGRLEAPGRGERVYLADMETMPTSPAGQPRAFLICASGSRHLEVAADSAEPVGMATDTQRISIAVLCPRDTDRIVLQIGNGLPGTAEIRHLTLREISPAGHGDLQRR